MKRKLKGRVSQRALGVLSIAALLAAAMVGVRSSVAAPNGTPQASLILNNADAAYCYAHDNSWTLTKELAGNTVENGSGTVTWTVTATKDSSAAATFEVHGGLTITNGGGAPASIGNIVVNLQKPNSPKKGSNASHVSIAANVANSTSGDAATAANIVAAASAENANTNDLWNTDNYTVSGAKGTFVETAGSGSLNFTDALNNSIFSFVDQPTIPAGESVTLLYHATFATSVLPAAGTPLRVEALVTFGNAGERGGSGSVASGIDINGNSTVDADEAKVRTVASRVTTSALPALPEECNAEVTLSDVFADDVVFTGTVTGSVVAGGWGTNVINSSTSFDVTVNVNAGALGGSVFNTANLDSEDDGGTLNVVVGTIQIGTDPLTGDPIYGPVYATYRCCRGIHLTATGRFDLTPPEGFIDGQFHTFSKGGFGGNGAPYDILAANFPAGGVEVGIPGAGGFSLTFTSADALGGEKPSKNNPTPLENYLPNGGEGDNGPLTEDLNNPETSSGGNFASQVVALKLNVLLSNLGATPLGFGALYYNNPGDPLHGATVSQILAAAETALGGGGLPAGYTYTQLLALCENLNAHAFHLGVVGPFASFLSLSAP